ncbi:MAG: hypothetical protein KatS3mg110_4471 [Pirellulaceae bacterium]|nr:MAG: hypothetical protein KatS3mg110_4471 [Pirellulaceae bacterium]
MCVPIGPQTENMLPTSRQQLRRSAACLCAVVTCLALSACATRRCRDLGWLPEQSAAGDRLSWSALPEVQRPDKAVRPELLSPTPSESDMGGRSRQYRRITAAQVVRAASQQADLANILEHQADWLTSIAQADHEARCAALLGEPWLRLQAHQERQQRVAEALRSFWSLAEAEQGRILLEASRQLADKLVKELEQLQQGGFASGVQRYPALAERPDIDAQLRAAEATILQLNLQLATVLGIELPKDGFLWPDAKWSLPVDLPELEPSLEVALEKRSDLRALQLIQEHLEPHTLEVVRRALETAGLVAVPLPAADGWFRKAALEAEQEAEVALRRFQVAQLVEARRRQVAAQLRGQHEALASARQSAIYAGMRWELAEKHRDTLRTGYRAGRVTVEELFRAELEVLRRQGELLRAIARFQRELVTWHELTGELLERFSDEPR